MLLAVNYHYVRPRFENPYPGIHGIGPDELQEQLELLGEQATFVSAEDVLAAVHGDRKLPDRALLVTFDDGLREQAEHACPVLDELGIPAVFFINTAPIDEGTISTVHKIHLLRGYTPPDEVAEAFQTAAQEMGIGFDLDEAPDQVAREKYPLDEPDQARLKYLLNFTLDRDDRIQLVDRVFEATRNREEARISRELYMEPEQIRQLAEAHHVGTHAHEHLPLAHLGSGEIEHQIRASRRLLERWTGQAVHAMSYPYGSRSACAHPVDAIARKLGVRFAFTMETAGNHDLEAPLKLARLRNNELPGGSDPLWDLEDLYESIPERTWPSKQEAS